MLGRCTLACDAREQVIDSIWVAVTYRSQDMAGRNAWPRGMMPVLYDAVV